MPLGRGAGGLGDGIEREIDFHFYHFFFVLLLKYKMHISPVHSISNNKSQFINKIENSAIKGTM